VSFLFNDKPKQGRKNRQNRRRGHCGAENIEILAVEMKVRT
jgi:hypothetical protein